MNERSTATHSSRIGAWLAHHGFSLTASLGRMLRTPWASCLTIAVMALALALPLGPERDLLLSITYIVVLSSILLQGLTIGKLVKHATRNEPASVAEPAHH